MLKIGAFILLVYLLTSLVVPNVFEGESVFFVDSALWVGLIIATLLFSKRENTKIWQMNKIAFGIALTIAVFQIILPLYASFLMGFARNATVWTITTLARYFPTLLAPFLAIELSRAYLIQTTFKNRPSLALLLISLFCTLIIIPVSTYASLTTPILISKFLIQTFLPTLATSLLASYLSFLGGFPANFIYMAIPTLFSWFSPILPNVPWTAQSLMTVATTTIGFIILDNSAKPEATRVPRRTVQKEKDGFLQWTVIALIGLIVFWSSTGLLGFTPTIVASGSMVPTLRQGDLTFIASTPARAIGIGDIIQYRMSDMMVIHRVIDKYETGGTLWFITKGDANNVPDDPVSENQVTGKLILTIPQLGWISVNLKEMFVNTYTFLVTTLPQSLASICTAANGLYAVTGLAATSYGCLLLTYKDYRKEDKK